MRRRKGGFAVTDTEIVDLFWSRSENAITELKDKYDRLAMSVAMNVLHDREDAEECVNDSYLEMWNRLPPERPKILPAFFTVVARNNALDRLRYNNAKKRGAVTEELVETDAAAPSPEEEINFAGEVITTYLSTVDRRSRVLFMRRYYLGESAAEAARAVGMTANHASVKLSRMREKLKKILIEEGFTV